MKKNRPLVNIVVRTFNEEDWIRSCLTTIFKQDYQNKVITVVDSGSDDATTRVVGEFPGVSLIEINDYLPGRAINVGIDAQPCDYVMILSAHCLIKNSNCISTYVDYLEKNPKVAGAYGRQLPLKYTNCDDARDLMLTFGIEERVQRKDSFFHNANSMLRMSALNRVPIDNKVKHIEDRLWAKQAIEAGYNVAYLPNTEVYHYHGLHQHGRTASFRAEGVTSLIKEFDGEVIEEDCKAVHGRVFICPVVIIVNPELSVLDSMAERIRAVLSALQKQHVYLFSDNDHHEKECEADNVTFLPRNSLGLSTEISFRELSRKLLAAIESDLGVVSDALSFVDMSYSHLNLNFVKLAQTMLFERFYKAVLPAWQDYGNYWKRDDAHFVELNVNYENKETKSELFRSVLGQGGCIRSSEIRSSKKSWQINELICTADINVVRRINHD